MRRNINCVILGAGQIGSIVAKELARFLSCYVNGDAEFQLLLCDNAPVMPDDINGGVYLPDDMGWSKSAVLQQLIVSNMNRHTQHVANADLSSCVKSYYCDAAKLDDLLLLVKQKCRYYSTTELELTILFDCTNNREVHEVCEKVMKSKEVCPHMLLITPYNTEVDVESKLLCNIVKKGSKWKENTLTRCDSMNAAYNMVAKAVKYFTDNDLLLDDVDYMENAPDLKVGFNPSLIVCVGAGGTGGDFTKEIVPYLKDTELSFLLIDGDTIEEKNCQRQPFCDKDIQQNKAVTLCNAFKSEFPCLESRVASWPYYIENVADLEEAIASSGADFEKIVLVGAVDNHRARQVLHAFFNKYDNVVYLDSGNEFDYGEVVTGVKADGKVLTPARAHYFPDVMTDNSPSASELSCGVVNVSAPQHQITNLVAGGILMKNVVSLVEEGKIFSGITYFDTFTGSREHVPQI